MIVLCTVMVTDTYEEEYKDIIVINKYYEHFGT